MKDELSQHQIDEILKILDDMLEKGPWEESNFLRVIGKNISSIRSDFLKHVDVADKGADSSASRQPALNADQQEIYISLYSSQGEKITNWERILLNLPRQVVSRPIYANEADLNTALRAKGNSINEAYVAVYINKSDILNIDADKIPYDKLGKPLLTLKDRAISLANINRFVHHSNTYAWQGGRLIRKNTEE